MRGLAYAKVNLTLEVLGKRADGYHELLSIMQTISLADSLSLDPAPALTLECDVPELSGSDNLVFRAAKLLGRGGHFRLHKRIPWAAGLGGGSSDAALALRLLNATAEVPLPAADLAAAAAVLGSDVPFFLTGGCALVAGRGEQVTALDDLPRQWLVLMNPGHALSTAAVFGEVRWGEFTSGEGTRMWLRQPEWDGPPDGGNGLQAAALRLDPSIQACLDVLQADGTVRASLSGSGPTVFALVRGEHHARAVAKASDGMVAHFVGRRQSLELD